MSSALLLAYNNRADGATLAGGTWNAAYPQANLQDDNLAKTARTTGVTAAITRLSADLGAARTLRVVDIANHNLSSAATWRVRGGTAPLDLQFDTEAAAVDSRLTASLGASTYRYTSAGLLAAAASAPRIDYNPATLTAYGARVEAVRQQLFLRTNEFSTTWSTAGGLTVAQNQAGPDGGASSAWSFTEGGGGASPRIGQSINFTNGTYYTMTVRAKERSGSAKRYAVLQFPSAAFTSDLIAVFDLATGTCTFTSAGVTGWVLQGKDGYWTISATAQATATAAGFGNMRISNATNNITNYAGDSTSGFAAYGANLFALPYPTSYVSSSAATTTTGADSLQVTGASFTSWWSAAAGSLYVEFDAPVSANSGTRGIASIDDGTANEAYMLYTSGTTLRFKVVDGGVTQADIAIGTIAFGTSYKVAVAWTANDFAASLSGAAVQTDSAGTLPTCTQLSIGVDASGNYLQGHVKALLYWPSRLTNTQLVSLATSGPTALGLDTGWVSVWRMTFYGDTPSNAGAQYDALVAFDSCSCRYVTIEFLDTTNAAGYLELGRLFIGGGFQPARGASYSGHNTPLEELSTITRSPVGRKFTAERRRRRQESFALNWLTQAEADQAHELMQEVGLIDEVVYVPNPSDLGYSQRYGGLGELQELNPLEYPHPLTRSVAVRWEQKL